MNLEVLAKMIFVFCSVNAKNEIPDKYENERICHEIIVNCVVGLDGKTSKEQYNKCTNQYLKGK